MPFELNRFKAKMDSHGGPARNNTFMVELYGLNSTYMDDETLRFFCRSVTVPGINLSLQDYSPRNFGLSEAMPTNITQSQVNALFIMDSEHRLISFFHEWMQKIVNYNTYSGMDSPSQLNPEQLPYEIAYKSDYAVNMNINHYSLNADNTYQCMLSGVFPTEISPSSLSWDQGELMTLSVNFAYNRIGFSGMRPGSGSARGVNLMDYYARFGSSPETQSIIDDMMRDNSSISSITNR